MPYHIRNTIPRGSGGKVDDGGGNVNDIGQHAHAHDTYMHDDDVGALADEASMRGSKKCTNPAVRFSNI